MIHVATCPDCGHERAYSPRLVKLTYDGCISCPKCECSYKPTEEAPKSQAGSSLQKRSKAQEKRAASRYGGHTQPASGSRKNAKGDFRKNGEIRGECKLTLAKSYSLKLADLMKLEQQATGLEIPVFEIEFQGVHPPKRFVVVPGAEFDALLRGQK